MGSRSLVIMLALALASGNAPMPSDRHPDLAAGISLLKEGDFEGAVIKLDAAVRGLETEGAAAEVAQAYLFLGIAYLELDQETLARGKFAQALARQPLMHLDSSEFSAQVIRIFEAVRQEALPAEADARRTVQEPPPPGEAAQNRPRKRSAVPYLILGGAVAAGGVALAASGGSPSASPTPTPTPTPSPGPTPTPTPSPGPTPTPTPTPAPCTFSASPAVSILFDKDGGKGTCRIDASRDTCQWHALSSKTWVVITKGTPGRGDGTVSYTVLVNQVQAPRTAEIYLQEDRNAKCQVQQEKGFAPGAMPSSLAWTSTLQAPGASGRLSFDGGLVARLGAGTSSGAQGLSAGVHRIEAQLTSGHGQPGIWRFRFGGALVPGSLRVRAGEVAGVSADTLVFRVRGMPGERVAFELEAGR